MLGIIVGLYAVHMGEKRCCESSLLPWFQLGLESLPLPNVTILHARLACHYNFGSMPKYKILSQSYDVMPS